MEKIIWISLIALVIGATLIFFMAHKKVLVQSQIISTSDGLQLYTEHFGSPAKPAVLLIAGAMAPARFWIDTFCQQLADAGYFVIRYDHRDMGLSSAVDYTKHPYTLGDLAKDVVAILDAYGIQKAHLIGHSMGGAIAQLLALDYPNRVLNITLISSSVLAQNTLNKQEEESLAKTWKVLAENKPTTKFSESVDGFMRSYAYLHGDVPVDKTIAENYIKDMYERAKPEHVAWFGKFSAGLEPLHNHVKAQQNIVDRTQDFKRISIPVLIIHGEKDLLAFPRVIQDYCAALIPQAQVSIIPGMGHMILNSELFEQIGKQWLSCASQPTKPILETERLLIRPFVFEDDQAVLDLFADGGAPHLTQYGPLDIDYARGFLRHTISGYQKDGLGLWAVIDKATGKLIGDCGLHKAKIGEHEEAVELAYRIHKTLWGKGFATEAAQAVLAYAFEVLHLPEIVSCIAHDNERSVRVAQKIGMTYWKEGVFMGKPCRVYRKMR